MRQTLFFIPDQLWGLPLFGFGWLLAIWLVGSFVVLGYYVKQRGWNKDTLGILPFVGLVAALIVFVLPRVAVVVQPHEVSWMLWQPAGLTSPPKGLPIRGYGACLLVATISGVALATYRGRRVGLSPDAIFGLAFNMFIPGIIGARLFWVIQKWESIYVPGEIGQTLSNAVNFVEGGLVVYGSLIGALLGAAWYLWKNKLPLLPVADIIAPSLPLGLAIGRIGCLMNGCCYGGVCDQTWALTFPQHSPPYIDQQRHGEFYGFRLSAEDDTTRPVVASVAPDSPAAEAGLKPGQTVEGIAGQSIRNLEDAQRALAVEFAGRPLTVNTAEADFRIAVPPLPDRSLPTHPTQVYSTINAFLLCLLTLAVFPFRRRDGEVFLFLIAMYAVTRFLLEVIRTDELGVWSTGMTISQNVSVAMLIGVAVAVAWMWKQPKASFWPT